MKHLMLALLLSIACWATPQAYAGDLQKVPSYNSRMVYEKTTHPWMQLIHRIKIKGNRLGDIIGRAPNDNLGLRASTHTSLGPGDLRLTVGSRQTIKYSIRW